MADYLLLFIGTVLVNNFVLVKFLGLCPFMFQRSPNAATLASLSTLNGMPVPA